MMALGKMMTLNLVVGWQL